MSGTQIWDGSDFSKLVFDFIRVKGLALAKKYRNNNDLNKMILFKLFIRTTLNQRNSNAKSDIKNENDYIFSNF